jgi:hypothetical protein
MPDFGMVKSHVGYAGRCAADHKINALRMADECQVCRGRTGAALGATRNMDGKRVIEKAASKGRQLLGDRARGDVTGRTGRASRAGRDAQARVGRIDDESMARGNGLQGKATCCLRQEQDRPARREADFGHPSFSGNAAETGEARCFDLAERQADAKGGSPAGKVEDADGLSDLPRSVASFFHTPLFRPNLTPTPNPSPHGGGRFCCGSAWRQNVNSFPRQGCPAVPIPFEGRG